MIPNDAAWRIKVFYKFRYHVAAAVTIFVAAIAAAMLAERARRSSRFAPANGDGDESPWLRAGRSSRLTSAFRA